MVQYSIKKKIKQKNQKCCYEIQETLMKFGAYVSVSDFHQTSSHGFSIHQFLIFLRFILFFGY